MPLTPGTQLGGYEITAALGAGGMGEVYRARDSKLGRAVAVKIVREGLSDPDRIARFEREAKLLAALNHPHIAALYGMEVADGRHFLVLELVEGETLADRLRRGPVPVGEALALATQIADALEAAHERGIVHRDLKPANVKVTPDDNVKVLDFGLAKAMTSEPPGSNPADSPTISMMASQAGVILGTASYMSPEQAKGLPADHRADVFSFGVVLYEMLSGQQPFQGETVAEVLASVLIREPDLTRLPPDLNPRLIDLVRRCLDKSPKRRWQAIGDLRAEIDAIAAAPLVSPAAHAAVPRPWWRRAIAPVVSAIVVGSIAAFAAWSLKPDPPVAVSRFSIPPPDGQSYYVGGRSAVAISPDGQSIVFSVTGGLFERSLSSLEARIIPGSEGGVATAPAYSPDGRSIVYFNAADQTIRRIDLAGGTSVALYSVTLSPGGAAYGFSWEHEGILLGQGSEGIARLSPNGGAPTQIIAVKPGEVAASPSQLPNGEIMFVVAQGNAMDRWETAQIVAQRPGVTERRVVVGRGISPRFLPTGHLLYALGGTLMATAFDPDRAETIGDAVPVVQGVRRAAAGASGVSIYAVSDSGLLAYFPGPAGFLTSRMEVTLTDRNGKSETLKIPAGGYETPRASPDGKMIALSSSEGKEATINVYSLAGTSTMRRLTYGGNNRYPVWSRDSRRLAFQSDREGDVGIFWQLADGTGGVERLTKPPAGVTHFPEGWSPVEDVLLFVEQKGNEFTLWTLALKTRKAEPFGSVRSTTEISPSFSPDGKWVAYSSNVTGGSNVYVQPYPATGAARQVFNPRSGGPHSPIWSHDGREILFNPGPQRFEAVAFRTTPSVEFGPPVPVARPFVTGPPQLRRQYDMTPSGRILGLTSPGVVGSNSPVTAMHVVVNWLEELKQRAPIR